MSAVRISVANLWTYRACDSGGTEREPLSRLRHGKNLGHVHGALTLEIAGRAGPYLGFLGPDDVCLNAWVVELCNAVNALHETPAEYVFDEGEQGQPAFTFRRIGNEVAFSITDSADSDGRADLAWQNVRLPYDDFRAAVVQFLDELREELRQHAPTTWQSWWPSRAVVR